MRVPAAVKSQLQASGMWQRFVATRDRLKREGASPDAAYRAALAECQQGEPTQAAPGAGAGEVAASAVLRYQGREEDLPRFVGREMFDGKKCSVLEAVQWCADNLAVENVKPSDAPSGTAWALFWALRDDQQLRNKFFVELLGKMLPSKTQIEEQSRLQDDGKRQLNFIQNLLEEAEQNEAREKAAHGEAAS